jgi:hypothetical protein
MPSMQGSAAQNQQLPDDFKSNLQLESESESESKSDSELKSDSDSELQSDSELESKFLSRLHVKLESQSKLELELGLRSKLKPESNVELQVFSQLLEKKSEDKFFLTSNELSASDQHQLEEYKNIVNKQNLSGSALERYMLQTMSINPNAQGSFIYCPNDFHKGPFLDESDTYHIIYGADADRHIKDNFNEDLFKSINGTNVTKGMMRYAEGSHWNNGLICHNENSIIVRSQDTSAGQPGHLKIIYFSDNLSLRIMKRYIVPELIKRINEKTINEKSESQTIMSDIINMYKKLYNEKCVFLNQDNIIEEKLFEDEPFQEILNHVTEQNEKHVEVLEWKILSMGQRLAFTENKITELEEIILDLSIRLNKFTQSQDSNSNLDNI